VAGTLRHGRPVYAAVAADGGVDGKGLPFLLPSPLELLSAEELKGIVSLMAPGDDAGGKSLLRRWKRLVAPLVAVSMIVAGAVIALPKPREVGWFAYAPLSNETFIPDQFFVVDSGAGIGYVLIGVGMVMLGFWSGYQMGSSRRRPEVWAPP
jgi:hypothetical protein